MTLAPIVLFVYNRLDHTRRTVEALRDNELSGESELFIFSDGSKDNEESRRQVEELRRYLQTISGFKRVEISARPANQGLARSIIAGVTEIVGRFGRVIVLEDDMLTSRYFLRYMNQALDVYADDDRVASIHAYTYPLADALPNTFFLRGADCWGWATWSRAWAIFEPDGLKLLQALEARRLTKEFDFSGAYPYTQMLRDQIAGRNNSWAIRWYASAFLQGKLTLYPGRSLVKNIGVDGTGTHCRGMSKVFSEQAVTEVRIVPDHIECSDNPVARRAFTKYFRRQGRFWRKVRRYLTGRLSPIFKL